MAERQATIVFTDLFETSFPTFATKNPRIAQILDAFIDLKTKRPPNPLPRGMRDHKLAGALSGYLECHLSGDILLLYTDNRNTVTLIIVCDHDDLQGGKAKSLVKKIKPYAQ